MEARLWGCGPGKRCEQFENQLMPASLRRCLSDVSMIIVRATNSGERAWREEYLKFVPYTINSQYIQIENIFTNIPASDWFSISICMTIEFDHFAVRKYGFNVSWNIFSLGFLSYHHFTCTQRECMLIQLSLTPNFHISFTFFKRSASTSVFVNASATGVYLQQRMIQRRNLRSQVKLKMLFYIFLQLTFISLCAVNRMMAVYRTCAPSHVCSPMGK